MCDDVLADIYVDKDKLSYERKRYIEAIEQYITRFGDDDVWIYSAPGRSEIGGNHTDHQHGEVLAASINHDVIAVAKKLDDQVVRIVSDGYNNMIAIHLDDLDKKDKTVSYEKVRMHGKYIGMNRVEMEKALWDDSRVLSLEDQERGFESQHLELFSKERVKIVCINDTTPEVSGYYIMAVDHEIWIYQGDRTTVYFKTDLQLEQLPHQVQKEIMQGNYIDSELALYHFL